MLPVRGGRVEARALAYARPVDRETLYQQILAHDDDAETQLVLADALQEAGDPRGRLLAVQYALETDPWSAALQSEEVRLIDRHADSLLGPLALHRYDDGLELIWHRGFVRAAGIDEEQIAAPRLIDELLRIPAVQAMVSLRIGHVLEPPACLAVVERTRPMLRHLSVGIDKQDRRVLADAYLAGLWEALPTLESLAACGGFLGQLRLPNLRVFDLRSAPRWDLSPLLVAEWPRLESLRLAGASVSPYSQLGERFVDESDVRTLIDALGDLPTLRSLALVDAQETAFGFDGIAGSTASDLIVEHIASSAVLGRLRRLELGGALSTRGVEHLLDRASRFAHLDELILGEPECHASMRGRLLGVARTVRLG